MGRVDTLPTARTDLTGIWQYIADDSPEGADRFLNTLKEKMGLLADNPEMGKRREELAGETAIISGWQLRDLLPAARREGGGRGCTCAECYSGHHGVALRVGRRQYLLYLIGRLRVQLA